MATTKYGWTAPDQWVPVLSDYEWRLNAFREDPPEDVGGVGRYRHFKALSKMTWPKLDWHDWNERMIRALSRHSTVCMAGCAAAGKTFTAAHWAMIWWMADGANSSVILTSTTGKSIRRRIWPAIQYLYQNAETDKKTIALQDGFPGNMVDSKTMLQAQKGDDKHGLFAIAVREGPVSKAVADIQGVHSSRMLIIIDEATDTPEAIFEAMVNLRKGCFEFQVIIIGNPNSKNDPHGLCCEPKFGWNSVTVEDDEWETAGVPKWQIEPGICLRFDGTKSPNIKLGYDKFPFLYTRRDLEARKAVPGGENSLGFWKFDRGFWAPAGYTDTVFSEPLIDQYDGRSQHVYTSKAVEIAGLDPAFTVDGDGCILRFALLGDMPSGKQGITLRTRYKIPIKAGSDITYQIANFVIEQCMKRGMAPRQLGIDIGGGGKNVADVIERLWQPGIIRVDFGGAASTRPVSAQDGRPANEVYLNRVTELWYDLREFLQGEQLKGLDPTTIVELCSREWEYRGKRIALKPKDEVKKLLGRSPDDADAVAVVGAVARAFGAVPNTYTGQGKPKNIWLEKAKRFGDVYDNDNVATTLYATALD